MHLLNRSILILSAKAAYLDWVLSLPIDEEEKPHNLEDIQLQGASYLVDEIEDESQLVSVVDRYWQEIITNELSVWDEFLDESPVVDRALFDRFFTARAQLVVADASKASLLRADLDID